MRELLFATNADEDASAGAEVREDDAAGLLFDQAVLFANEGVVREHEIADGRPDL